MYVYVCINMFVSAKCFKTMAPTFNAATARAQYTCVSFTGGLARELVSSEVSGEGNSMSEVIYLITRTQMLCKTMLDYV